MATQVQWRGGSTAEHATFTGAAREVTVDTQKKTLVVHDGSTAGGEPLLREDQANLPSSVTNGLYTPGTNQVALSTAGTGRLFVDANGRVGVGISAPGAPLAVASEGGLNLALVGRNNNPADEAQLYFMRNNGSTLQALIAVNNDNLSFHTGSSGSERLRITADGKVGVGTSAPAVSLHVSGTTSTPAIFERTGSNGAFIGLKDGSGSLSYIANTNGVFSIQTPGSGYSDKLVVTSDGNVGVGTSTPNLALHVSSGVAAGINNVAILKGGGSSAGNGAGLVLSPDSANTYNTWLGSRVATAFGGANWGCDLIFSTNNNSAADNLTERMRIGSSGDVLIGTTTTTGIANGSSVNAGVAIGTGTIQSQVNDNANQYWSKASGYTSSDYTAHFVNNTYVGGITTNGSGTSYVTSSDYRLKENVVPLTGAISRISALQVHRFNFISNPDLTVDGFLAHEAQAVVPECVTGEKDAVDADGKPVYQGIDQSKLVPLLTAALQEAVARIETLEAKVAALESA